MDKEKDILAAALKLFVENGFHGTPTSRIAKEAGVANGTLFHYFPTKDELIIRLHMEVKAQMTAYIMSRAGQDKDLKAQLQNYYMSSLAWALAHTQEFHYIQQFHTSPYAKMADMEQFHAQAGGVITLLKKGIEKGLIKPLPMDLIFSLLSSHLFGIYQYILSGSFGKKKQQSLMDESFGLIWDMIS